MVHLTVLNRAAFNSQTTAVGAVKIDRSLWLGLCCIRLSLHPTWSCTLLHILTRTLHHAIAHSTEGACSRHERHPNDSNKRKYR